MARSGVKLNSRGVQELLNSAGVRDDLTTRAERVLSAAQAIAPVASADYRDGLEILQDTTDRAVVRVASSDFKGHIIEARDGVLAQALDAGR